ncbi:galactose-binding domain-containing protein, partial [Kitasatospora sp. NPDC001574]
MFRRPALRAPSRRTTPVARPVASLVAALALLAGSAAAFPTVSVAAEPAQAPYGANDVPVLIVLGQSNAEGWGAPLDTADKTKCQSLNRVKGLNRTNNRVAGATSATWSPYTCKGNNLGQEHGTGLNSGFNYNVASATALRWQRATEAGTALPDLNVIHVAWGSQGVLETEYGANNRWYPGRDPNDVESLFPLAMNTITNGLRALEAAGKQPRIIGIHWNQWEAEAKNAGTTVDGLQEAFLKVLNPLRTITGDTGAPIFLYQPRSRFYVAQFGEQRTQVVTEAMTTLIGEQPAPHPYRMLDAANATTATGTPLYNPNISNYGIYTDGVHYTGDVHKWFTDQQWKTVFTDQQYGAFVKPTVNAALGRPATQSSTNTTEVGTHSAGLAVDGNPSVGTTASLSATVWQAQPWWQTDLGAKRQIRSVEILNRSDSGPNRLTDLYVMVSPTSLTGRTLDAIKADPTVRTVHIAG